MINVYKDEREGLFRAQAFRPKGAHLEVFMQYAWTEEEARRKVEFDMANAARPFTIEAPNA